jgi:MoaA/NifB/PqqE/SkfB family radical SAM enzyme
MRSFDLVHLLVTNRCNLNCAHCLAESGKPDKGEFSTEEMIEVVKTLNKVNYNHIHFEGGEPFFHPEFDKILGAFDTLSNATVISNGTIPYDERFEILKEKKIDGVMLSLDNFGRPVNAQYKKIIPRIIEYKENGLPVKIRSTIHRGNMDFMKEIVNIASDLRIQTVRFGTYKVLGRGVAYRDKFAFRDEDYKTLFDTLYDVFQDADKDMIIKLSSPASFTHTCDGYKIYQMAQASKVSKLAKLVKCFAFNKQFNIFSNGDVTPCNESSTPFVLGNLRKEKLEDLLDKEDMFKRCQGCGHGHLLISSDNKTYDMQ